MWLINLRARTLCASHQQHGWLVYMSEDAQWPAARIDLRITHTFDANITLTSSCALQ